MHVETRGSVHTTQRLNSYLVALEDPGRITLGFIYFGPEFSIVPGEYLLLQDPNRRKKPAMLIPMVG